MGRALVLLLLATHLLACADAPATRVDEFLDERTGASLTAVHRPLTFALERSTLAAHARDYVSLMAVQVDRSGKTELYAIGYFWSTIDRRKAGAGEPAADHSLLLFGDGRVIRLKPLDSIPPDLERKTRLYAPETAHFEEAVYRVREEWLAYLADSRALTLRLASALEEDSDNEAELYHIWTDARPELKQFVERIGR